MIYLVEDDESIRELVVYTLKSQGMDAKGFERPSLFWKELEKEVPALILLDIMLPGADGFELMDLIRPTKTPVIFLTARGSVSDRVNGLRAGADDYLVKPFDIVELIARVESVLRRTGKTGDRYTVGDVCIDARAMRVTRGGEPVLLTPKEFDLLLLFVQNRNIALFRETIYERVWGTEFTGDSRTVDLHVQRLRRKLGWQGKLLTIYKTGYRLEVTD